MNYHSPNEIRALLAERGLTLKKRWGQNFLISKDVLEKIVGYIRPMEGKWLWEIGPGLGALTRRLVDAGARLTLYEIDWGMISWLGEAFTGENIDIVQGDVLKTWKEVLQKEGPPDVVCGNLPYSSASAIILAFILEGFIPKRSVYTVQRELAQRMTAPAGSKNYSSFSVLVQSFYAVKEKTDVAPGSFYPAPDVTSTILSLEPAASPPADEYRPLFFSIVRDAFRSRRKKLVNNLRAGVGTAISHDALPAALEEVSISENARAEELSPGDFMKLAASLHRYEKRER